jgi:hypothetical protein
LYSKNLYERVKTHADRTNRCYLTLNCNSHCSYCSAGLNKPGIRRNIHIAPELWAEGLNRRKRDTILCGGEPFLYPYFNQLISRLDSTFKVEIYTNLGVNVDGFLNAMPGKRRFRFLISLHDRITDFEEWYKEPKKLKDAGNSVRFHVVKFGNWEARRDFLQAKGEKVTCCDDQGTYCKSTGKTVPLVHCKTRIYIFGPDGHRYMCTTKMLFGENPRETICMDDAGDYIESDCERWGACNACDNLIEGETHAIDG